MRKPLLLFMAFILFVPALAAQSAWDGTWKFDLKNANFPKKPDIVVLQNGMYECKSCVPPYKVKADGTDQPVSGHPYRDSIAVKVIDDNTVQQTDKKNGKVVSTSNVTISPDGKTQTFQFTDSSNTNGGAPVTGKGTAIQIAKGPAGSHAVSGSWRTTQIENISDNGITWNYKLSDNELTMTAATGQSFTAKLDGTDAPMKGDPGITSVSLRMLGKNTLEETDKRDGKVIGISKMTLQADGKSAKIAYDDKLHDTHGEYIAVKQ
jgi:hypothetical protein